MGNVKSRSRFAQSNLDLPPTAAERKAAETTALTDNVLTVYLMETPIQSVLFVGETHVPLSTQDTTTLKRHAVFLLKEIGRELRAAGKCLDVFLEDTRVREYAGPQQQKAASFLMNIGDDDWDDVLAAHGLQGGAQPPGLVQARALSVTLASNARIRVRNWDARMLWGGPEDNTYHWLFQMGNALAATHVQLYDLRDDILLRWKHADVRALKTDPAKFKRQAVEQIPMVRDLLAVLPRSERNDFLELVRLYGLSRDLAMKAWGKVRLPLRVKRKLTPPYLAGVMPGQTGERPGEPDQFGAYLTDFYAFYMLLQSYDQSASKRARKPCDSENRTVVFYAGAMHVENMIQFYAVLANLVEGVAITPLHMSADMRDFQQKEGHVLLWGDVPVLSSSWASIVQTFVASCARIRPGDASEKAATAAPRRALEAGGRKRRSRRSKTTQ
jgi:hypothetical protein